MISPHTEIKLIVFSLIARATPTLLEGKFEVADPLNTVRPIGRFGVILHTVPNADLRPPQVTQPPKGTLVLNPLEKPYL